MDRRGDIKLRFRFLELNSCSTTMDLASKCSDFGCYVTPPNAENKMKKWKIDPELTSLTAMLKILRMQERHWLKVWNISPIVCSRRLGDFVDPNLAVWMNLRESTHWLGFPEFFDMSSIGRLDLSSRSIGHALERLCIKISQPKWIKPFPIGLYYACVDDNQYRQIKSVSSH